MLRCALTCLGRARVGLPPQECGLHLRPGERGPAPCTGPQALPRRGWLEVAEQGALRVLRWPRRTGGVPKARAFSRDQGERGKTLQKPRPRTGGSPGSPAGAPAGCPWAGDWRRRGQGPPQSPASGRSGDHRATVPPSPCSPASGRTAPGRGVPSGGRRGSGPGARSDRQRPARMPLCLDGCWMSLRVRAFQFKKSYFVKISRKKTADLI